MKDEIIASYKKTGSIKETSRITEISCYKVRRILLLEKILPKTKVQEMYENGMTVEKISEFLKISKKAVQAYLPYFRQIYSKKERI